jgi:hypothetical protein
MTLSQWYNWLKRALLSCCYKPNQPSSASQSAKVRVDEQPPPTIKNKTTSPPPRQAWATSHRESDDGGNDDNDNNERASPSNFAIDDPRPSMSATQTNLPTLHWRSAPGELFRLRVGPNYKFTGKKAPSADPMYELVGVDLFQAPTAHAITNILGNGLVQLPSCGIPPPQLGVFEDRTNNVYALSGLPRLFLINIQMPHRFPQQPAHSLVLYFCCRQDVAMSLVRGTASPAARLLHRYIAEHAYNPDMRRRLKALGGMEHKNEASIPLVSMVLSKINGTPVMLNRTIDIFHQPGEWFEVDLALARFPFLAQRSIFAFKENAPDATTRLGFAIQGETNDELPEVLWAAAEISGMDFSKAVVVGND